MVVEGMAIEYMRDALAIVGGVRWDMNSKK